MEAEGADLGDIDGVPQENEFSEDFAADFDKFVKIYFFQF
jgi:hypothetical protein